MLRFCPLISANSAYVINNFNYKIILFENILIIVRARSHFYPGCQVIKKIYLY